MIVTLPALEGVYVVVNAPLVLVTAEAIMSPFDTVKLMSMPLTGDPPAAMSVPVMVAVLPRVSVAGEIMAVRVVS